MLIYIAPEMQEIWIKAWKEYFEWLEKTGFWDTVNRFCELLLDDSKFIVSPKGREE